jgi:hypothetical protein
MQNSECYIIYNKKEDKAVGFDTFGMYYPERFGAVHLFHNRDDAQRAIETWYEHREEKGNFVVRKVRFEIVEEE